MQDCKKFRHFSASLAKKCKIYRLPVGVTSPRLIGVVVSRQLIRFVKRPQIGSAAHSHIIAPSLYRFTGSEPTPSQITSGMKVAASVMSRDTVISDARSNMSGWRRR